MRELRSFVYRWVRRNLVPLHRESDTTVETWLQGTNYPEWRRKQLLEKWSHVERMDLLRRVHKTVKSFMKDEFYPEPKHGRGINSRTDEFKCAVGPIFKLIEQAVFKHPQFIKYVPVDQRPAVIKETLQRLGGKYISTDYTSFESLFTREVMESIEFVLYEYMVQSLPEGPLFMQLCREVLGGVNECRWRRFIIWVTATRMSGEMCTSLGNGFSNLMLMLFVCWKANLWNGLDTHVEFLGNTDYVAVRDRDGVDCVMQLGNRQDVNGFVEGDDGIFSVAGKIPTTEDFARVGMVIKLEVHSSLSTASFCGIVFDENDLRNLTDPLEVVAKFGYANHRYTTTKSKKLRMLLRCKALSLAHQYPGSPIIQSLAWYGLRMTDGVRYYIEGWVRKSGPAGLSMWERDQLLDAISTQDSLARAPIGYGSRLLVEQLWGIPVLEQIAVEDYLDRKTDLSALNLPGLVARVPSAWIDYWNRYADEDANVLDDQLCEPRLPLGPISGLVPEWEPV